MPNLITLDKLDHHLYHDKLSDYVTYALPIP